MTSSALDIYKLHLTAQVGENSPFTETAIYDPSGADVTLYGVFDDNTYRSYKDAANVVQKKSSPRFIVSENVTGFDVYADKDLFLTYRNRTYKIEFVDKDEQGLQVLWLY